MPGAFPHIKKWLLISRWWSFFTDLMAVTFGSVLALPSFSAALYIAMLAGTISINAFANFMNDIYDFKAGEEKHIGDMANQPNPIAEGSAGIGSLWSASAAALVIGVLSGIYIASQRGPIIIALGLVGIISAYLYSAGRRSFKSMALGEVLVFIIFGPLMTGGAYFVETGSISAEALVASSIIGILIALILFANNVRDIAEDKAMGFRTVAIMLGPGASLKVMQASTVLIYSMLAVFIYARMFPPLSGLAFITVPLAIKVNLRFTKGMPKNSAELVSKLAMAFTMLASAGFIAQYLLLV